MLCQFSFQNFKSYKGETTLDFQAATLPEFKETLKDGTTTEFTAQVSVKRTGGGVNGVIEFMANMALQSMLKITDPSETQTTESAAE